MSLYGGGAGMQQSPSPHLHHVSRSPLWDTCQVQARHHWLNSLKGGIPLRRWLPSCLIRMPACTATPASSYVSSSGFSSPIITLHKLPCSKPNLVHMFFFYYSPHFVNTTIQENPRYSPSWTANPVQRQRTGSSETSTVSPNSPPNEGLNPSKMPSYMPSQLSRQNCS